MEMLGPGLFLFQPSRHQPRRVTWMSALAGGRSGGLPNMLTRFLYTWLVVTGTMEFYVSIQLGMSSSQLTNSYFLEG